ncbi:MAG: phosphatidate cytidylyltransferase [Dokdonella sp.]|uniref:phosphatidate cytidylyltransferase n=1 Tax=Dokdonella sp. TaxID=2291710 RepID=UPI003262DE53
MLRQRILTALVLAPVAIAIVLFLPTEAVAAIIAALCLMALWEWTRLAGVTSPTMQGVVVVTNAVAFALLWLIRNEPAAWYVIGAGIGWWMLALLWMRHSSYAAAPTRENAVKKLVAAEFAILPAWLSLVMIHGNPDHGHAWALFTLVLIWSADSAAYFAGKRFGTTKLAPQISPNKTLAGVWGALAGAGSVALLSGWLFHLRGAALALLVVLSLLTILASILGDLVESLLKRQANVKDSGTLFPGHGGLLDRLDSLFAAIPVFAAGKFLLDLAFAP